MKKPVENKGMPEQGIVRIQFKPGRTAADVAQDENGFAFVSESLANHLVSIGYAIRAPIESKEIE